MSSRTLWSSWFAFPNMFGCCSSSSSSLLLFNTTKTTHHTCLVLPVHWAPVCRVNTFWQKHCLISASLTSSWCQNVKPFLWHHLSSQFPKYNKVRWNLLLCNWSTAQQNIFSPVDQSGWDKLTFLLYAALYWPISNLLIGAGAHVWNQGHRYLLKDLCRPPVAWNEPSFWPVAGLRCGSCGRDMGLLVLVSTL